ncbi:hypothetical protein DFP72DRAFT_993376 [Ephemerocybe angulata]|uniref:CxC2-like cysteine cluster KDZ transposase-associated domain-containing protein n=1 Tax=Ephemerocybe angulata TaxID=980116 RepID=A0A8H6HCH9_9AGAR|nr:hypothetical protein DFP72DRAFT_993376 [Tulosesus angulatus]
MSHSRPFRSLQTTKLKTLEYGGFRVASKAAPSGVCAPDVAVNDSRTTEEILASWLDARDDNGWDPAYTESFLERDLPPPMEDPEDETGGLAPKEGTGQGRWNGHFFVKTPLKSLGLRMQLGHSRGEVCPLPDTAWGDDFVIIDVDGVHTLGVDYCACGGSSKDQYESKVSPYELYNTLSRLTDNTGIVEVKDRYPSFLRMVHEWRHLKLLKRTMRGHDPVRTAAETKEGECALLCPPCPHPKINMPEGWEDEPEETRYIHALNLALDACFRLKRKDVSSEKADPGLSKGFAYFVHTPKFVEYLDQHEDEVEPKSSCSRHDAVNLADVSPGQGLCCLRSLAPVECARHNMKRPSAVYCNMDFIFSLGTFYISYDIACQWSKSPILRSESKSRFMTKFAFMFTPGAGLGDGEAPERGWGEAQSSSTKHAYVPLSGRRWIQRLSKVAENTIAHSELEETLDPVKVKAWTESMVAWERDPEANPNPFEMTVIVPTQVAVRKVLADEEAAAISAGKDISLTPDVSPSVLISRELTRIQLRSNALVRRIDAWYQVLQLYIPTTILLRQKATGSKTIAPYDLHLWLPSEISNQAPFDCHLAEIEYKLRAAQAQEALTTLRRCLQRRVTVYDLKKRWLRGQAPNTKALNLLGNIEGQIGTARDEYRQARMLGKVGLENFYLPLEDADIRAMAAPDIDERAQETMTLKQKEKEKRRTHETQRTMSWIWRHASASEDNHTEYEAEMIKVEWAKSRARAARYHEEVKIVREEMRRTIRFFTWKENEWYSRAEAKGMQEGVDEAYREGLRAYAKRQGAICLGLRRKFEHMWAGVDNEIGAAMSEISNPDQYYARLTMVLV